MADNKLIDNWKNEVPTVCGHQLYMFGGKNASLLQMCIRSWSCIKLLLNYES